MAFKTVFVEHFAGSNIAASGTKDLVPSRSDRVKHKYTNFLEVHNKSTLEMEIYIDGITTDVRPVRANSSFVIDPATEDQKFQWITVKNLDGSTQLNASEWEVIIKKIIEV